MPQTTVNYMQPRWLGEGQLADTGIRRIDGAIGQAFNGIASGVLPFGRVAVLDPVTHRVTKLNGAPAAGSVLVIPIINEKYGISLSDLTRTPALPLGSTGTIAEPEVGYPAGTNVMIDYITFGDVIMYSEEPVNQGDALFYRHTADAAPNNIVGRVLKTTGANTAALTNVRAAETRTSPGLIVARVFASVSAA